MSQQHLRDEFLATLHHIGDVVTKVTQQSGPKGFFNETDIHTVAEGLFLSAFTHWEQFTRNLLIEDVATNPGSRIRRDVLQFSDPDAAMRLAIQLLTHPDHPQRFIEW